MQLNRTIGYELPADFPVSTNDQAANYLRWQECIFAGQHVANICFNAKYDAAPGSNEELLARAVLLVCGDSFSDEESRCVMKYSAAQLGW